jgi:tellurite resistance protein
MGVPAAVRLDVRLVAGEGGRIVLARPAGDAWFVLPGGPVAAGEDVEPALARHLDGLGGPTAAEWRFAGAVEHTDALDTRGASPGASGGSPAGSTEGPLAGHTLTLLFAADWPAGVAVPATWQGYTVATVDAGALIATRLRPLPVASAVRRWLAEGWPSWRGIPPAVAASRRRLRPSVASLRAQLAALRVDLRSRPFRDAAVAMCALVTAADGRVDPAERDGLRAFVATDPVMANFPADELEDLFDAHLARLQADFAEGKRAALTEIAKVRGRIAEATAVIRIGEVIGRIDDSFPQVEQAVVRDAAKTLGLDPAEFAL